MNYWETEEPLVADTGKNIFRYFPISRKLNISKPDWTDKRTGETKQGKTVAIDLDAAATSKEAMSLLTRVLTDIKKYSL